MRIRANDPDPSFPVILSAAKDLSAVIRTPVAKILRCTQDDGDTWSFIQVNPR